jgi:hypothetical protein
VGTKRAPLSAVPRAGLSRYAYQGRHRSADTTGSTVRSAALGAGVVAAVVTGTALPAAAASGDPWAQLRQCESGGNYSINTGNGYYGAYQFDAGTWHAYGGAGLPSDAPASEQDYRAKLLYQARGWAPWPACSRKLGLAANPAYGVTGTAPAKRSAAAPSYKVTVGGPKTSRLQAAYRISGWSRPNAAVTVQIRAGRHGAWRAYAKKTDGAGNVSVPWRARTDYQYRIVDGHVASPIARTRVATTAAAAAARTQRLSAGGGPQIAVSGTAVPDSRMIVFVRSATGRWGTWKRFSTDRTGKWTLTLEAPSKAFQYYAKSANGLRSRITSLNTTRA